MTSGKIVSQAGHAYVNAILQALEQDHSIVQSYQSSGLGTKVCLAVANEEAIMQCFWAAQMAGLPTALIVDSGHVMPPSFDGSPITTALGIGPCTRIQIDHITRKLNLL